MYASRHLYFYRPRCVSELLALRSSQLHCGVKINLKKQNPQLCLLPPRKCVNGQMENWWLCLSSTLDSHCKWRWPPPWRGRAYRWDRRRPQRDPGRFRKPLLRSEVGAACAPSQRPAPAAQQTAWRARTIQGELYWIYKEILLHSSHLIHTSWHSVVGDVQWVLIQCTGP